MSFDRLWEIRSCGGIFHTVAIYSLDIIIMSLGVGGSPAGLEEGSISGNSPNDQVDNAEVEDLLVRVVVGDLLLFFLDPFHHLLSLLHRHGNETDSQSS